MKHETLQHKDHSKSYNYPHFNIIDPFKYFYATLWQSSFKQLAFLEINCNAMVHGMVHQFTYKQQIKY